MSEIKQKLLDAVLGHVPFDGWSRTSFEAAVSESGVAPELATLLCPRGAVDLAVAYHQRGDARMLASLGEAELSDLKFRERVALAVRLRLEAVEDKELVRRGTTLFANPIYATDGAQLVWGTCGLIWEALGDSSQDLNWYTKRATLSGVYTATVLFWLGDTSEGNAASWAFLDRRIENVMQIEKLKAGLRKSKLMGGMIDKLTETIRAPQEAAGLPGQIDQKGKP